MKYVKRKAGGLSGRWAKISALLFGLLLVSSSAVAAEQPKPGTSSAHLPMHLLHLEISPDGSRLAVLSREDLRILDPLKNVQLTRLPLAQLVQIRFSPDSKRLVLLSADGQFRLLELASGRLTKLAKMDEYSLRINTVAFYNQGRSLGLLDYGGGVTLFDLASGRAIGKIKPIKALAGDDSSPEALAISPDGKQVVRILSIGTYVGEQMLFTTKPVAYFTNPGKPDDKLAEGEGFDSYPLAAAFSPNGRWLALQFGELELWDRLAPKPKVKALIEGGGSLLAFNAANRLLAASRLQKLTFDDASWYAMGEKGVELPNSVSVEDDKYVLRLKDRLIDLQMLEPARKLPSLTAWQTLHSLAFSPDGQTLYGAEKDLLQSWNLNTGQLLSTRKLVWQSGCKAACREADFSASLQAWQGPPLVDLMDSD